MTDDRKQDGDTQDADWTGDRWAPGHEPATTPADAAPDARDDGDRWNKTEYVGDQGHGAPSPVDPSTMPEGDNALSGDRHAPGEQHWVGGDDAVREPRTGDRPLEQ